MPRLSAVVFDLDGTLAASMENHWKSFVEVFRTELSTLREPTFLQICMLEGKRAAEVIQQLGRDQGMEIPTERARALGEEKQRLFRHHGHVQTYPGAHELLASLKARGVKVGMATGTNRENVKHMLGPSLHLFETIVTGEDVKRSKPDPEPYLKAFDALGVAAAEAAVVENAPLGLQSARAAGARVVAVAHTLTPERLVPADAVAKDLREVDAILARWAA